MDRELRMVAFQKTDHHPMVAVQYEAKGENGRIGVWDCQAIEEALEHALEFHRQNIAEMDAKQRLQPNSAA